MPVDLLAQTNPLHELRKQIENLQQHLAAASPDAARYRYVRGQALKFNSSLSVEEYDRTVDRFMEKEPG